MKCFGGKGGGRRGRKRGDPVLLMHPAQPLSSQFSKFVVFSELTLAIQACTSGTCMLFVVVALRGTSLVTILLRSSSALNLNPRDMSVDATSCPSLLSQAGPSVGAKPPVAK